MDLVTRAKWDKAAANFDVMAGYGPEKRWEPTKRALKLLRLQVEDIPGQTDLLESLIDDVALRVSHDYSS